MVPLKQWVCDKCEGIIKAPDEGLLEWVTDHKGKNLGYRIVHQLCCYKRRELRKRDTTDHVQLEELTGSKGLITLIEMLEKEEYLDRAEFKDMIRRIHVEYYEEARLYWSRALQDGVIRDVHKLTNFYPDVSLSIIHQYRATEHEKVKISQVRPL